MKQTKTSIVTEEYLDIKLAFLKGEMLTELKDFITENTSKLYTRIDPLLSELEDRRDDRALTTEQIARLDVRVAKLETQISPKSS